MNVYKLFKKYPLLFFLIFASSFITLGSFMIMPFMTYYLNIKLGIPIETIGLILSVTLLIQFSGSIFGGLWAEKFGLKNAMILGLSIRTLGFIILSISVDSYFLIIIALIVISIGTIFYLPSAKAYIALLVEEKDRELSFSLLSSAGNLGMSIGPLIAAPFIDTYPSILFKIVAILFIITTLMQFILIKKESVLNNKKSVVAILTQFTSTVMLTIFISYMLCFFIYMLFQNFLGLYVGVTFSPVILSYALLINSLIMIFGATFATYTVKKFSTKTLVIIGSFLCIAGFLMLSIPFLYTLFLGVILISIFELIVFLKHDILLSKLFPNSVASGVGILRLAAGIGSFFSALAGGYLYKYSSDNLSNNSFWLICTLLTIISVLVFYLLTTITVKK